jgi:hypothetical protein
MYPKSSFLKCVEFRENGHFSHFFQNFRNFRGHEKFQGNFRQKSPVWKISWNFFAEIGCIFATYRKTKTAKKKTVSGEFRGFSGFSGTTFPEIFQIYTWLPNFTCTLLRRAVSVKTPKMHKLFPEFPNFGNPGKIFPNFRAVFRRFSFFRNFQISNRTNFFNLHR